MRNPWQSILLALVTTDPVGSVGPSVNRRLRSSVVVTAMVTALVATVWAFPSRAAAGPPWGPETPPFNLQVILRDVTGGSGFGLVTFRQPNDAEQVVYLDTWVRDLTPNHDYLLQRAVDAALDGTCTGSAWLTLGKGLDPQAITTDDQGWAREALFRALPVPPGSTSDIHFRVVDATTMAPVLASDCYRFSVSP
jgi:hypothetical protein